MIDPEVGVSTPSIKFAIVVFPEPDSPTIETESFFSISKLTSSTATTLVKPTLNTLYKFFMLRSLAEILMRKFGLI